jgi:hypothetical protein
VNGNADAKLDVPDLKLCVRRGWGSDKQSRERKQPQPESQ